VALLTGHLGPIRSPWLATASGVRYGRRATVGKPSRNVCGVIDTRSASKGGSIVVLERRKITVLSEAPEASSNEQVQSRILTERNHDVGAAAGLPAVLLSPQLAVDSRGRQAALDAVVAGVSPQLVKRDVTKPWLVSRRPGSCVDYEVAGERVKIGTLNSTRPRPPDKVQVPPRRSSPKDWNERLQLPRPTEQSRSL
jgi:hypothetical protein